MQTLAHTLIAQSMPHSRLAIDVAALAPFTAPGIYHETPTRHSRRALLDAAGILGATVRLGFFKVSGELRYMLCSPVVDADGTCRYYTVKDLELSEAQARPVYRRVNLDSIAALRVDYSVA